MIGLSGNGWDQEPFELDGIAYVHDRFTCHPRAFFDVLDDGYDDCYGDHDYCGYKMSFSDRYKPTDWITTAIGQMEAGEWAPL